MYLNFARRSFTWPGVAGARVQAGLSPHQSPAGVGDCVLLNFQTGLFALSDSSDRDPSRSREFLLRFDRMVSTHSGGGLGRTLNTVEIRGIAETLTRECEKILEAMRGAASCTCTGIHILKTHAGMRALLFHTGDSCVYEYDLLRRRLSTLAVQNFWMIGKTMRLYQITALSVKPHTVFIWTTDGVTFGRDEPTHAVKLGEMIDRGGVENLPDGIMHMGVPAEGFRDDAAVIALSVQGLQYSHRRIIMGGTTARQESEYTERCRSEFYKDCNVRVTENSSWGEHIF
jgi:hypothetical protein